MGDALADRLEDVDVHCDCDWLSLDDLTHDADDAGTGVDDGSDLSAEESGEDGDRDVRTEETAEDGASQPLEHTFTDLSINDVDALELYRAAMTIQQSFREYCRRRERKRRRAATVIQAHFRRFRTRRMEEAALRIQRTFRNYRQRRQLRTAEALASGPTAPV